MTNIEYTRILVYVNRLLFRNYFGVKYSEIREEGDYLAASLQLISHDVRKFFREKSLVDAYLLRARSVS